MSIGAITLRRRHASGFRARLRARTPSRGRAHALLLRPELLALLGLTAALNLWNLSINGWANLYYAAAVRSMSASWHNFLFISLDHSGLMTVDKPPLSLWIQALSARAFGFHPLSLLVPQALMGVAAVALVYDLVRRRFGRVPAFAAGVALALTPVVVAVSRHNNPDELELLCTVAAMWCALRALENGRLRWLLLSGVAVGLGFETKMGVALFVVPGISLAWLWLRVLPAGGRRRRVRELSRLLGGGLAMVAVGAAWPLLITLTPASQRPWISGTSDNSIWSLILGYNGLGRVAGQSGGPPAGGPPGSLPGALGGSAPPGGRLLGPPPGAGWLGRPGAAGLPGGLPAPAPGAGVPAGGFLGAHPGGPLGGPGGSLFGGATGPGRLLQSGLGDQAGWLLGFALIAGLGLLAITRLRRDDARSGWLMVVGGGFLCTALVFSFAGGIFHPYYVSLLAPATAALVGAGVAQMLPGAGP